MIVRIVWGRLVPGAWGSIEQIFSEHDAASTPGLRARLITQDVNDAESMYAIAFWDDLASVERWLASDAYRTGFAQALRPFLAGSQSVSMAEVKVADVAGIIDAASL
ncbi:MAG: antibiotic biosynthesis monooxygenase, partial [Casimicrobiaceae bacterium]